MKDFGYFLLWCLGIAALWRWLNKRKLTIVLYHGVAPHRVQGIYNYRRMFIAPEAFGDQLAYLKSHYTVLPLDEACERLRAGTLPPNALAITFDDGYRNNFAYAYPSLKQHRLTATFFLTTNFVFKKEPLWLDRLKYAVGALALPYEERVRRYSRVRDELKKLPDDERQARVKEIETEAGVSFDTFDGERAVYAPLTADDIAEMRAGGMTFGAHTESHPILTNIARDRLQREIRNSKDIVTRECGGTSSLFCYPNGQAEDFNAEVEKAVRDSGFAGAVTTLEGTNDAGTDVYKLRRITMDGIENTATFAVAVSGLRGSLRGMFGL
jgi:peptidoglycan/xylan/chitin deacetylase (PgdA/CDA1 family)